MFGKLGEAAGRLRTPSFPILCTLMAFQNVAANVVHPVEPAFYIGLGLPDWIFGAAFAAMSLGLFLMAPFWGMVSDRFGRIPTFTVTSLLYGLAQLAFLVSTTVPTVLLARFAAGAMCSGCGVATMAYVADISPGRNLGRRMTLYAAVCSCATALGYLVGGVVGEHDPGRSFILQFFILLGVAVLAFALLREGDAFEPSPQPLTLRGANPLAAMAGAGKLLTPWLAAFLLGTLFAQLATSAYDNAFNYYLRDQFAFPPTYNGYIYAVVGILGLLANLTVGLRLQRSRDVERSLGWVLVLAAVTLATTLAASTMPLYLGLNVLFYVFNSMYLPLMQAQAIQGETAGHGAVSGLFQSVKSLGMVVGSLVAGFIYEASPLAPFVMAAAAFALAAAATFAARRIRMRRR